MKRWLLSREGGVFIILLGAQRCDGTYVDHFIVLNCNDRVVSDDIKKLELWFVFEVFDYFVGEDARDLNVK